jgi:hypothetical protein
MWLLIRHWLKSMEEGEEAGVAAEAAGVAVAVAVATQRLRQSPLIRFRT